MSVGKVFSLFIIISALLTSCSSGQSKKNLEINNDVSLFIGTHEHLETRQIDSLIEIVEGLTKEEEEDNFFYNYNLYQLYNRKKDYNNFLRITDKLFKITQSPTYLIAASMAYDSLGKKDVSKKYLKEAEVLVNKNLAESPVNSNSYNDCMSNLLTIYCMGNRIAEADNLVASLDKAKNVSPVLVLMAEKYRTHGCEFGLHINGEPTFIK